MSIGKSELLEFIQGHRRAVAATHALDGAPQAALISFVIDEQLQLFFDSFGSSRKVPICAVIRGLHWSSAAIGPVTTAPCNMKARPIRPPAWNWSA